MEQLRRWFLPLVVALALVAAGCGGGDDGEAATGPVAEDEGAPAANGTASDDEPQPGGTLIELMPSYIDNMDPHAQSSYNTQNAVGLASSRLLAFETGPGVEYGEQVLVGDLAESWDVSDDGLTYTFNLRDDVVWHDIAPVNGRPFVADDVVATFERIRAQGFQAYMLERVASIEAPDDHTVVVTMSAPFAPFLSYMASHYMWIMPREATDGTYDPAATVIGTGPFIMESREPNVSITYRANPDYYGEGPYIDGVRRLVVPDQGARIAAFRAGEADLIYDLSPEENDAVLSSTPGSVLVTVLAGTHIAMMVNQAEAPVDDLQVRKALNLAIDRRGLMDALTDGGAYSGPVVGSLGQWALDQDELGEIYRHDPEEARQLLADAGHADGLNLTLTLTSGYGQQVIRAAEWVKQDLAEVGVNVELEVIEYATYFGSRWPQKQYQLIVGPQTPFLEPDEWLRGQHHSEASRNWFNISDPVLDEMLVEQLETVDPDERLDLVHDVQRYITENVMNPIPLWVYNSFTLASERVRDWYPSPDYGYFEYRQVWLDEG